jgi:hypothetical protein
VHVKNIDATFRTQTAQTANSCGGPVEGFPLTASPVQRQMRKTVIGLQGTAGGRPGGDEAVESMRRESVREVTHMPQHPACIETVDQVQYRV